MSSAARLKHCVVAYAMCDRQYLWSVELQPDASVADAIAAARRKGGEAADIPWSEAPVGIFGQLCDRATVPGDGDRIELYRPLAQDPRQARRRRVIQQRGRKA